jgi:hypothetical protein
VDIALAVIVGLVVWCLLALAVAVVVGRMCRNRDRQVGTLDRAAHPDPESAATQQPSRRRGAP